MPVWLVSLLSPLIEKFLIWIFGVLQKDYLEWKQKRDEKARAKSNADKVDQSTTDEERHKDVENLLNDRD